MKNFEIKELKKALNHLDIVIGDINAVYNTSWSESVAELESELERSRDCLYNIIKDNG